MSKHFWMAAAIVVVSTRSFAQVTQETPVLSPPPNIIVPNYNGIPTGPLGGLEGSAHVARAGDTSAPWFNPAGLPRSGTQLSGSVGNYQFTTVTPKRLPDTGGSTQHLPNLVDYEFTAQMEDLLDAISRGESESNAYLQRFYFGDNDKLPGLKAQLDDKIQTVDPRDLSRFSLGQPDGTDEVFVRVGKFGPFIEHGERKASIPQDMPPDELTLAKALSMLEQASVGEEPLGVHPDTQNPLS